MRFLGAECVGPRVAEWLRKYGYEVCSIYDEAEGMATLDSELKKKVKGE